jgi:hypothetical protein
MYFIIFKIIFLSILIISNLLFIFNVRYSSFMLKNIIKDKNTWFGIILSHRLGVNDGLAYSLLVFSHLLLSLIFSCIIGLLWIIFIPFFLIAYAFNLVNKFKNK